MAPIKQAFTGNRHELREYIIRQHLEVNYWKRELRKQQRRKKHRNGALETKGKNTAEYTERDEEDTVEKSEQINSGNKFSR